MLIIPAIDIRGGACVRLTRGDPKQATVYSNDPVETAKIWAKKGAKRIHVVDLDGAFTGENQNLEIAGRIKKTTACEIQFGGGLRSPESAERALALGIDKLILGTAAFSGAGWVKSLLRKHREKLIVALDALEDSVALQGWRENSGLTMDAAVGEMESLGFTEALYTDINRDGTLQGANVESVEKVVQSTRMKIYASGGVMSLQDLKALKKIAGLFGVVIGKALYNGNITLEDCLSV